MLSWPSSGGNRIHLCVHIESRESSCSPWERTHSLSQSSSPLGEVSLEGWKGEQEGEEKENPGRNWTSPSRQVKSPCSVLGPRYIKVTEAVPVG